MSDCTAVVEEAPRKGDVIIAIDFGTSRTAYSWTVCGDHDRNIVVETMESAEAPEHEGFKTMTSMLLDENSNEFLAFGHAAESEYGRQRGKNVLLFERFKMELHDPPEKEVYVNALGRRTSLPVSFLIQKSLEFVKDEAMKKLGNHVLKNKDPHDAFWVLTVPAIWSDYGKGLMRKAAFEAGLIDHEHSSKLKLALEPECAAIAAYQQKITWDKGVKFMVADCGAGTLDFTAFEVVESHPLELRQLIVAKGGAYGAGLVDDKFFDFLKAFLGMAMFDKMVENGALYIKLKREWEMIKRRFNSKRKRPIFDLGELAYKMKIESSELGCKVDRWNDRNPGQSMEDLGEFNVELSNALMKSFFTDPIEDIVRVTADAVEKYEKEGGNLDHILLAGGFAKCSLLQEEFKTMFEEEKGIDVYVGEMPDIMIVKGAAIFGVRSSNIIKSRKAKYTFGVHCSTEYDKENEHHKRVDKKKIEVIDGVDRIKVFSIHGKKGDDVQVDSKTRIMTYLPLYKNQSEITFDVLVTEREGSFFLTHDKDVVKVASASVPVDMSLPFDEREVGVQFAFGDTEIICCLYDQRSKKQLGRVLLDHNFIPRDSRGSAF